MALLLVPLELSASWNLSGDVDARATWADPDEYSAEIHAVGLSIRKSFADNSGDKVLLAGLAEAKKTFSELMIHELYVRYKGPMGVWNITAGRIGIPYGLLTSYSTSRLLFESPLEAILGFDADNGVMFSGISGIFDYGLSFSQGYGIHRVPLIQWQGYGAGRVGATLGDAEEFAFGLSVSGGDTLIDHMTDIVTNRITGGLDATLNFGQAIIRAEANAGQINQNRIVTGYGIVDFAFHERLDFSTGIRLVYDDVTSAKAVFAGFTFKPPWFTFRGAYTYENSIDTRHTVSVQLYRLFAHSF